MQYSFADRQEYSSSVVNVSLPRMFIHTELMENPFLAMYHHYMAFPKLEFTAWQPEPPEDIDRCDGK